MPFNLWCHAVKRNCLKLATQGVCRVIINTRSQHQQWLTTVFIHQSRRLHYGFGGALISFEKVHILSDLGHPKNSVIAVNLSKRQFATKPSQSEQFRDRIVTIPNILSLTRIALSPVLCYMLFEHEFLPALMIFMFAGLTDLLDGWIARRYSSQSSLIGTVLDPIADKILMCTLTISLTAVSLLPVPITVLILSRDVALVISAFHYRIKTLPPPVTFRRFFNTQHAPAEIHPLPISKLNTALQLTLVTMCIAAPVFDFVDHPALQLLWYTTGITTIVSGISYMKSTSYIKAFKKI